MSHVLHAIVPHVLEDGRCRDQKQVHVACRHVGLIVAVCLPEAHRCSGCAGHEAGATAQLRLGKAGTLLAKPLRIISVNYRRYRLPLAKPLTTGSGNQFREGFLLEISTQDELDVGCTGIGEAAPLPGESL